MRKVFSLTIAILIGITFGADSARASIIDDLQQQISGKASQIKQLEQEIKTYTQALTSTQKQSNSLKTEIQKIDLTRKQLSTDIKVTETNIVKTGLTINKLDYEITDKQSQIQTDRAAIAEMVRNVNQNEAGNIMELFATDNQLSDIVGRVNSLNKLNENINNRITQLKGLKINLEKNKQDKLAQKNSLTSLKSKLSDQKQVVDETKKEKDTLLQVTKAQESNYQKLIADRRQKMQQVQDEISQIESKIKVVLNPSLLPKTGTKALQYPLDNPVITQRFGQTAFAKVTAVYEGKGHNGVDFGTKTGTPIKAANSGTVMGAGDTDLTCRGASYGRWIMIQHDNGLSSLYGHLSVIKVSAGQRVEAGDIIAYSGNTGYSTGPHLHFTVYATQGVHIGTFKSKVAGCGTYTLPIAATNAYLDPLQYLKK